MRTRAPLVAITMLVACTSSERTAESPTAKVGSSVNEVAADETRSHEEPGSTNQPPMPAAVVSACKLQEGIGLKVASVKALGTEPFWGARTDGRCVTYSTPEDQAGTRVWAKVASNSGENVWTGSLRGKPFRLSIRPKPGCSDGMSDNEYPMEALLVVDGGTRSGCAEPL